MGHRKFTDRDGNNWQIKEDSRDRWTFQPLQGNPHREWDLRPPGYETDPYELSAEEVQRLFDANQPAPGKPKKSPFID